MGAGNSNATTIDIFVNQGAHITFPLILIVVYRIDQIAHSITQ